MVPKLDCQTVLSGTKQLKGSFYIKHCNRLITSYDVNVQKYGLYLYLLLRESMDKVANL